MRYKGLIQFLLVCALAASGYLLYASLGSSGVAGCGPASGCDRVLQSRWSHWFGIPVGAFSVAVYGALLALTFRFGRKADPATQRSAWRIVLPLTALVIASILWFTGLQIFVIKQMCKFCMTVHGAGLLASILLVRSAPIRKAPDKPWQAEKQVFIPPRVAITFSLIAIAAFAVFAGGQVLHQPKTYAFQTYDGKFRFDLTDVPLIGSPKNTNAIVSIFDYTCHHCRIMHWHLSEVVPKITNQVSIISLPNPLDSACNPNVRRTPPPHTNACEYAKLGLAVWRANHKAQHEFDDWIFKPEHPPGLVEARQYAANLVGSNQLARALQDPWVTNTMRQGINIYSTNYLHYRNGNMPQLIIGTNLTQGTFSGPAELYKAIEQQLGLKPPSS